MFQKLLVIKNVTIASTITDFFSAFIEYIGCSCSRITLCSPMKDQPNPKLFSSKLPVTHKMSLIVCK